MKTDQKTGSKTGKTSVFGKPKGKPRGPGKKFRKNDPVTGEKDERINRTGQNAKFTFVRQMANRLFEERLPKVADGRIVLDKKGAAILSDMIALEAMLREWITSRDYQKQNKALELAVGKVPDELHVTGDIENFIKSNLDLFTDGQLQRLQAGENPLDVLAEVLRDALKSKKEKVE